MGQSSGATTASATASTQIEFHPAWHELMSLAYRHGDAFASPGRRAQPGAHVARGMLTYLWNQGENGICCPIGMTYSAIPALVSSPISLPCGSRSSFARYDARPLRQCSQERRHGRHDAMTEKQGGSDLRATQTTARPAAARRGPGEAYLINGHKWFFSVPASATCSSPWRKPIAGLSCFLLPGWLPDGTRNRLLSSASRTSAATSPTLRARSSTTTRSAGSSARRAGHPAHHLAMTHLTRLDFAIGSAGLMRQALSQAIHHATGAPRLPAPLSPTSRSCTNVLADLALEVEATTLLASGSPGRSTTSRPAMRGAACSSRVGTPVASTGTASGAAVRRRGARMPWRQWLHRGTARWRGSIARRRSTASGRAPATSSASTCCGPAARCRRRADVFLARSPAKGADRRLDRGSIA